MYLAGSHAPLPLQVVSSGLASQQGNRHFKFFCNILIDKRLYRKNEYFKKIVIFSLTYKCYLIKFQPPSQELGVVAQQCKHIGTEIPGFRP